MIHFQINEDCIFIYGFDGDFNYDPYEADETPIYVYKPQLLETMRIDGIGENLSAFIIDLTSYPWVDRCKVEQIIVLMKIHYPESNINWEDTFKYLEGYN